MSEKDVQITDVLGIKEYGEAAKIVAQGTVDAAGAFLGKICLPAAEELGFFLRDKVSNLRPLSEWRVNNLTKTLEITERLMRLSAGEGYDQLKASPRLVRLLAEQASWTDESGVQKLWAGLLSSSCTIDGKDESNLIFISLLTQLTSVETRILNYGCEHSQKNLMPSGLVTADTGVYLALTDLQKVALCEDFQRLDREMDHLRTLGLIYEGFPGDIMNISQEDIRANIAPTMLCLQMYVRCQGTRLSPSEYFEAQLSGQKA